MKRFVAVVLIAIIALPLAAVATFLLMPVWRWLERVSNIESVGHSGPATWCFVMVYVVVLVFALVLLRRIHRKQDDCAK